MAALLYIIVLVIWEILYLWSKATNSRSFLNKNPIAVIGGDGYWASWKTCLQYFFRWPELMQTGYSKYKAYQMPTLRGFVTFLNDPSDLKDFFLAPETALSQLKPLIDELQLDYTLPSTLTHASHSYLSSLVRRTLDDSKIHYDELSEEMNFIFQSKVVPKLGEEGRGSIPVFEFAMGMVSQVANRTFVGKNLCRNKEYLGFVVNWAECMGIGGQIIKMFPKFLKPFVARYLTNVVSQRVKFEKMMDPIVRERVKTITEKSPESPSGAKDDFLDALIKGLLSRNNGQVDSSMVARLMLIINASAIHTTVQILTAAIHELGDRPELCEMLREEFLEKVGGSEGYENANAITKELPILDSFLKEVARIYPPGHATSFREVIKGFTFSSGLHIPAGVMVIAPTVATYRDPKHYPSPDTFDPLRFVRKSAEDKMPGKFVDTSTSSYLFSHGIHVCPGRWAASAMIKLAIIKLIEKYDIRLEEGKPKPKVQSFQVTCAQDMKSKIEIRRREGIIKEAL